MVAAPLLAVTVPVDIATSAATPKADAEPLTVTVASYGTVFIGSTAVAREQVVATILDLSQGETDRRIYRSGAKDVTYQQVVEIMGLIDAAGFNRIGLLGAGGS